MRIPISEARARLSALVRHAEAGEEVILTRHGQAVVRLVGAQERRARRPSGRARRALMEAVHTAGSAKATKGPSAARSQDFLYGDDGLPK